MDNSKIEFSKYMYCADCKKCTDQKLLNSNYDGKSLYICCECGCENSLENDED